MAVVFLATVQIANSADPCGCVKKYGSWKDAALVGCIKDCTILQLNSQVTLLEDDDDCGCKK